MPIGSLSGGKLRAINMGSAANIVGMVGVPALLFFATDCGFGTKAHATGVVVDRRYEAAYTTVNCDGKNGCNTTYHPARHILIVGVENREDFVDVEVSKKQYYQAKQEQQVLVNYRKGRFTKWWYLPAIDKGSW